MGGFEDVAIAAKMRDLIAQIVRKVLSQERPAYNYGTVVSIDVASNKAMVRFGDDSPVPVKVNNASAVIGSTVRIEGLPGERYVAEVIGPSAWSTPALVNGWTDYHALDSTYAFVNYWRDGFGTVFLRGIVKAGTTTVDTTMFTLPPTFRPLYRYAFPAIADTGAARVDVRANGAVTIQTPGVGWVSLNGISYRAQW